MGQLRRENEDCAACKYFPRCRGGCRNSAIINNGGDLKAVNPVRCTCCKAGFYDRVRAFEKSLYA